MSNAFIYKLGQIALNFTHNNNVIKLEILNNTTLDIDLNWIILNPGGGTRN